MLEHVKETLNRGGQGSTNNSQELIDMVTSILLDTPTNSHKFGVNHAKFF